MILIDEMPEKIVNNNNLKYCAIEGAENRGFNQCLSEIKSRQVTVDEETIESIIHEHVLHFEEQECGFEPAKNRLAKAIAQAIESGEAFKGEQ